MPPCRHEPVQCGGIGRLAGRLSGSGIWRFVPPPPPLHRAGTQFFYSAAPPPSPRPSLALTHTHSLLYAWNTHAHLNYSFGVDESRPLAASGEGGYDDNLGTPTPLVRVRDDGHCGTYSQYMQSMYVGRTERPTGILSIAT